MSDLLRNQRLTQSEALRDHILNEIAASNLFRSAYRWNEAMGTKPKDGKGPNLLQVELLVDALVSVVEQHTKEQLERTRPERAKVKILSKTGLSV